MRMLAFEQIDTTTVVVEDIQASIGISYHRSQHILCELTCLWFLLIQLLLRAFEEVFDFVEYVFTFFLDIFSCFLCSFSNLLARFLYLGVLAGFLGLLFDIFPGFLGIFPGFLGIFLDTFPIFLCLFSSRNATHDAKFRNKKQENDVIVLINSYYRALENHYKERATCTLIMVTPTRCGHQVAGYIPIISNKTRTMHKWKVWNTSSVTFFNAKRAFEDAPVRRSSRCASAWRICILMETYDFIFAQELTSKWRRKIKHMPGPAWRKETYEYSRGSAVRLWFKRIYESVLWLYMLILVAVIDECKCWTVAGT